MPFVHTNKFGEKHTLSSKNLFKSKDPAFQGTSSGAKEKSAFGKAALQCSFDAEKGV